MDILKRAWLYVTRKKGKSIIMLFILFAVSTSVLSGVAIKKATKIANENATNGMANFFNLRVDISKNMKDGLSRKTIEKVAKVEGIESYNALLSGAGEIEGFKKVKPTKETPYNYEGIEDVFRLNGNENTESDLKFINNMLNLVEGSHIKQGDKNKVLIHKSLAELNNLKIGDKITLKRSEIDYKAIKGKGKDEMTLEIVGIFERGNNEEEIEGDYLEIIENNLLCDNSSIEEFYGYTDADKVFDSASFYGDKNTNIDSIIAKAKKLPLNWNEIRIEKSNDIFLALSESFERMDSIINMMLIGSIVISAIILALILTFWIQGRIHETGILLSIGVSKFKIIGQYIVELLIISVLAFSISYFSGQLISQKVGENLMTKASTETVQSLKNSVGVPLGNDAETKMLTYTSNDIDVKISAKEMLYVWAIGTGIIVLAVSVASSSIIRLKPKEILSKMS